MSTGAGVWSRLDSVRKWVESSYGSSLNVNILDFLGSDGLVCPGAMSWCCAMRHGRFGRLAAIGLDAGEVWMCG